MLYGAHEGQATIHGATMDYVTFGRGQKPLVILPGLSDGLKTVHGQAATLALYYRQFARQFKVYIFSRKNVLEEGCTIAGSTSWAFAAPICTFRSIPMHDLNR